MDYQCKLEVAADDIGAFLEMTQGTYPDLQGAYTTLKRYYRHTLTRQPSPPRVEL